MDEEKKENFQSSSFVLTSKPHKNALDFQEKV
jgi:hypothetical protein